MSLLEEKIRASYSDAEKLITLIRKTNLETTLNNIITKLDAIISNNDLSVLPTISGNILHTINRSIGDITNAKEKGDIKYLLSDIFKEYIKDVPPELLIQIKESLKSVCDFESYDSIELFSLFDIDRQILLQPKSKTNKRIYYDWKRKPYELDGLVGDLYAKKWIYSVKEFKRLFKPQAEKVLVRCNEKHANELLIFFSVLREKNFIQPKGNGNSGHFAPFVNSAVDNEENILYKKPANKIHDILKRNDTKYSEMKRVVENLIDSNLINKNG